MSVAGAGDAAGRPRSASPRGSRRTSPLQLDVEALQGPSRSGPPDPIGRTRRGRCPVDRTGSGRPGRPTRPPEDGRRWTVRSGLMNVAVAKSSSALIPLPKSATATARCSVLGCSPATTGTASRNQAVAGPGRSMRPVDVTDLHTGVVEARVVAAPGRVRARRRTAARAPGPRASSGTGTGSVGSTRIRTARAQATSTPPWVDDGVDHLDLAARAHDRPRDA